MSRSIPLFASLLACLIAASMLLVEACGSDTQTSTVGVGGSSSGSGAGSGSNTGSGSGTTGPSSGNDAGAPSAGNHGGSTVGASGTDGGASSGSSGGGSADSGLGSGNGDGGCVPWGQGLIGSNTAPASYTTLVFGCDGGVPGFCDNGVRQMPPTCDPVVDALITRTPPTCASLNSTQSYNLDQDPLDVDNLAHFTADMCNLKGAVYWVSKMNIDCDGKMTAQCPGFGANMDPSYQPDTFVQVNGGPLTSQTDPYVVIPNDNYRDIPLGAVVAVVYGRKVVYAIFGDTGPPNPGNPARLLGEGSVALANALGIPSSPSIGGAEGKVVTYIAFTSTTAVPTNLEDQNEIDTIGKRLTAQLIVDNP